MNKAVFLDRDGTINIDRNYIFKTEDFTFLPGALEGMKLIYDAGFLIIVITNQSGIARGYYSEEDCNTLNRYMSDLCMQQGVEITDIMYCPHLPDAKVERYRKICDCRKPETGLFMKAVEKYDIDLSSSYAIGDKMRDLEICNESGCSGFLISNDKKSRCSESIEIVGSLYEAANIIVQRDRI